MFWTIMLHNLLSSFLFTQASGAVLWEDLCINGFICVNPYHCFVDIQRVESTLEDLLLTTYIILEGKPYWWPPIWWQGQPFLVNNYWVTPLLICQFFLPFRPVITSPITQDHVLMFLCLFFHIYPYNSPPLSTYYGTHCSLHLSYVIFTTPYPTSELVNNYKHVLGCRCWSPIIASRTYPNDNPSGTPTPVGKSPRTLKLQTPSHLSTPLNIICCRRCRKWCRQFRCILIKVV